LILYSYITKAKDAGIKVETQIDLPKKNAVADMDLCVIFANAIENAVNACKRVSNSNGRTIKIFCAPKNDKLFIQITNDFEGTVLFLDEMPVSIEKNHGLGTKSIAAVAQAYAGIYSFTAQAGVFTTSVIL
jgi:sensor histidine kinase regulating citrate/malate metabolism